MNYGAIACGIIGGMSIHAALKTKSSDMAFGFWLLAVFSLIGAANS